MTIVQETIAALLIAANTNAGANVFPWGQSGDSPAAPYLMYHRMSAIPETTLAGGIPPLENTHMQIDCFAPTYLGAQTLANQVRAAMLGWAQRPVLSSSQDAYEDTVKLHRVVQQYSIWS